jgi:hypothetical protein
MAIRRNQVSLPPKKIPALITVPTGEILIIEGRVYRALRLERAKKYI